MTMQFNTIPASNLRVPIWYAEINGAQTPYVSISRLLLCGQMAPGGVVMPGQPMHVRGDGKAQFGSNSMLADMIDAARKNAPFQEVWVLPMFDSNVGVKATGKIKLPRSLTAKFAVGTNIANLATGAPLKPDGAEDAEDGDLVLVFGQNNATKNGLYVVSDAGDGANGVWVRADAMSAANEFENFLTVTITDGDENNGKRFRLWRGSSFTLDTTEVNFTEGNMVAASQAVTLWVGDIPVQTVVYTSDTGTSFAARLRTAINGKDGCPVTAAINGVNDNEVDLTARHAGSAANSIYLDTDYYGTEGPLAGALFTFTQMANGSGDPDFSSALAALGDDEYDWIVGPYANGEFLASIDTLLNGTSGRWSPFRQLYGHYLGVFKSTVSDAMTFGKQWNMPHTSLFPIYGAASPSWRWAGALGGRMAAHLTEPPELSRPLQTLDLKGILPPKSTTHRPDQTDRQALYWSGMSSYHVDGSTKTASIDRIVTTYQVNEWGSPDASWLDVETRAQAMYAIRALRARVTGQWGRSALMDENPDGLTGVATPKDVYDTIVHEYKRLHRLGVVENPDLFQSLLVVERNISDANRLDIYCPADHANQLRIIAVNYTSFLQFNQ